MLDLLFLMRNKVLQQTVQHLLETSDRAGRKYTFDRLDVLEGPTGRRRWTAQKKASIVAESCAPGARVGDVGRRHGLTPQHLTSWRRLAREGKIVLPAEEMVGFAPIVVEDARADASETPSSQASVPIEIETEGFIVRVPADVAAGRLAEIVGALRAAQRPVSG